METEIWKDIKDYEGLYQVSNLGRVKQLTKYIRSRNNSLAKRNEKILSQNLGKCGYYRIGLTRYGKQKVFLVHRLVAQAFIPNPDNLPQVNHKDENKVNNNTENLEWCTHEYNHNYGTRNNRQGETQRNRKDLSKRVLCIETGEIFPSIHEAARFIDKNNPRQKRATIGMCCNLQCESAYGFHWCFIDKKEEAS